jgi:hypothetical protein
MQLTHSHRKSGTKYVAGIVEAKELARHIGVPEDELQQMAARMLLPFSFSTIAGLYVRRSELDIWEKAAAAYRGRR